MAAQLPPPTQTVGLASEGYERQNTNFNAAAAGHINIGLVNIDTAGEPKIERGSVIEVNGGLYAVSAVTDESITGTKTSGAENYIYAVPQTGACVFQYGAAAPAWSAAKGGWYSGSSRAVAKLFYSSNGPVYGGKVILDCYNAIFQINTRYTPPSTGGSLALTGGINTETSAILPAGAYRYELKGGTGGSGGTGGGGEQGAGGGGAAGEYKTGTFILATATRIFFSTGGDGNDGASGWTSGRDPGGGGGCTGGASYLVYDDALYIAMGGSGGGGGGGASDGANGGGGGGGYGTAGDGGNGTGSTGGRGGSNGRGGDGSGGGSGYVSGGSHYDGYGQNGGGYGQNGGKGDTGANGIVAEGGISKGKVPEPAIDTGLTSRLRKYFNAYQGGGGGGSILHARGGVGGSGLKTTSSGYARFYRVG
jgi:hypothetical protein